MKKRHLLLSILLLAFCATTAIAQNDSQAVRVFENEESDFIAIDLSDDEVATFETAAIVNSTKSEEDIIEAEITAADSHYHGWVAKVVQWYSHHVGYTAVGALMTIESSFIPFPSEIVIPPAVMVAADPQSPNDMKIWLIVLIGTLGALLGAYINYFLSRWLGRPIIYKFVDSKVGHALRLSGEKMERAEKYFNDHGVVSTLVGRLIPVIRQLISIPAGLSKMNVATFTLYTFLGAAIWNCVLALLGYLAVKAGGMDFIFKYSGILSKVIIILFVVAVIFLILRAIIKKYKSSR